MIFKNPDQRNNCVHFSISDLDYVPCSSSITPGFMNGGNNWIFEEIRGKALSMIVGEDSKE